MATYSENFSFWEPNDEKSLSANLVQWTRAEMSLEQLVEDYEFPQIIRVTLGYFDPDSDESAPTTLSGDELVLLHEYFEQSRVVAVDKYDQHISIAKDFSYKFEVCDDPQICKVGSSGPFTLPELLERYSYPVKVRLARKGHSYIPTSNMCGFPDIRDFGDVTLTMTHTVHYLFGHCLNGRDLNSYRAIVVLPVPKTEIDCQVGTIAVDGNNKDWKRYLSTLSKMARDDFDFKDFVSKESDAYLLQAGQMPEEENVYESIKPTFIQSGDTTPGGSAQPSKIDIQYGDYRRLVEMKKSQLSPTNKDAIERLTSSTRKILNIPDPVTEDDTPPPKLPPRKPSTRSKPPVDLPPKPQTREPVKTPTPVTTGGKNTSTFIIPKKLDTLSVGGVGECLKILRMEEFVDQFRDEQVDGSLLCAVSVDILKKTFGMNDFQAIKLNRFIHEGWRPNFGK